MSARRKRHCSESRKKERDCSTTKRRKVSSSKIGSLTDICARYVAERFAYEYVENTLPHIPEPIQEKIVFWAFPKNENDIALYSSTSSYSLVSGSKQPFQMGIKLLESGNVKEVLQIGKIAI